MNPRIKRLERTPEVNRRVQVVYLVAVLLFLFLFSRLYYLQAIKHDLFFRLSEDNRVRIRPIRSPRGLIMDRNGVVLADSIPAFKLICTPYDVVDVDGELDSIMSIVDLDREEARERILKTSRDNPLGSISLASDLTFDQVSSFETLIDQVPGFSIVHDARRNYPYGSLTSHALGYVGEANLNDLKEFKEYGVIFGDYVGKSGVERAMEDLLHGRDGMRRVEVDALGREKKELDISNPEEGEMVHLNLDMELQSEAEKLFRGRSGSIIGLNPKNGEVYLYYSSPSYDPNLFARGIRAKEWERLIESREKPLQNRVIQGLYAPGSTVKPLFALMSLQEDTLAKETDFFCGGEFFLGNDKFRCWKKGGHGDVAMGDAIIRSCDIYFYNLGLTAGVDRIGRWASIFGLNEPTGIDIPSENKGLAPDRYWKKKRVKERWYDGDTVVASIGQGYFSVTPVELAVAYAAVANGGRIVSPRIVKMWSVEDGESVDVGTIVRKEIGVDTRNINFLRNALEKVVSGLHGTGKRAALAGVRIAGKTGTAQVVSLPEEEIPGEKIAYYRRDHAWFVGFAPADDPEICVAVLVEHGGGGGETAAPLFQGIMRKYFRGKNPG